MIQHKTAIILILFSFNHLIKANYNETLALEFVHYAFATYCDPSRLALWDVGTVSQLYPQVKEVTVVQSNNNLAYVAYNFKANAILVSFRGSSNIQNWIENINFVKSNYLPQCNCKVHGGFLTDYESLRSGIFQVFNLLRAKYQDAQVHVTGHSLGAALSTLFSSDLFSQSIKVDFLINFGSPRVGDAKFYYWYEAQKQTLSATVFRITHGSDPVPHLPPQILGFYHINTEIFYNPDAQICRDIYGEDPQCIYNHSYSITNADDHLHYLGVYNRDIEPTCGG